MDGEKNTERPSIALERHADEIIAIGARLGVINIRVFGSCVRGSDTPTSDIDLIADLVPGTNPLTAYAFPSYVEELTGFRVDFVIDGPGIDPFFATTLTVPL